MMEGVVRHIYLHTVRIVPIRLLLLFVHYRICSKAAEKKEIDSFFFRLALPYWKHYAFLEYQMKLCGIVQFQKQKESLKVVHARPVLNFSSSVIFSYVWLSTLLF